MGRRVVAMLICPLLWVPPAATVSAAGLPLVLTLGRPGVARAQAEQVRDDTRNEQSGSIATESHVQAFIKMFVSAIARRDRDAVASMVRYPAKVSAGGFNIPVPDRDALFEVYDTTFTPELRCLVEESGLPRPGTPAPKYAARLDGPRASLGDGRVETELADGALKITSITVPLASAEAAPPPAAPRRVQLRGGQAQYAGRLYAGGVDAYLVTAAKGARLQARIERFPGNSAGLRVVNARTGRAVARPGGAAARTWAGPLPDAGDYRVEVVRRAPYCDPSFTYLLTLALR